jgi:hypothetical protein
MSATPQRFIRSTNFKYLSLALVLSSEMTHQICCSRKLYSLSGLPPGISDVILSLLADMNWSCRGKAGKGKKRKTAELELNSSTR